MQGPPSAMEGSQPTRVTLRGDKLARVFLALCLLLCLWLAVAPVKGYLQTSQRAAEVSAQRERLQQEQRLLKARSAELSRGSGLEEQARRQGLIESTERSYVIEDLPQP
ncbi:MAG: septum formation initiator family protein [Solirubrobacteraceae bacterium]|nr:septum formation initiator family protein [Solirubrobacteraceae bacterium]